MVFLKNRFKNYNSEIFLEIMSLKKQITFTICTSTQILMCKLGITCLSGFNS